MVTNFWRENRIKKNEFKKFGDLGKIEIREGL